MGSFFSAMFAEIGARRRRMRAALGDRGQALTEFLVLGGLALGSLGLFVRPWMPAAAPWGFWLPLAFVIGYLLLEARRQQSVRDYRRRLPELNNELDREELTRLLAQARFKVDQDRAEIEAEFRRNTEARRQARMDGAEAAVAATGYDWATLLWSLGCALAGAAAFTIAWTAAPPANPEDWTPPESAVPVDISP